MLYAKWIGRHNSDVSEYGFIPESGKN